jgi:hypothetical protein
MPAASQAQRRLMALAEHNPSAVYPRNQGVLDISKQQLHGLAATPEKGLPKKKPVAKVTVVRVPKPQPIHPALDVIRNH